MDIKMTLVIPKLDELDSKTAMNALRERSPEIGREIRKRIEDRTPEESGALKDAITFQPYTDEVSGKRRVNLVRWYAEDGPQLESWNRVYVANQEGPPLGRGSNTATEEKGWPHQMFKRIETDDQPLIQEWVDSVVGDAVGEMVSGEDVIYGS